ncbi:MAG: hypothetical protein IKK13_02490 [Clostridia bacterium]|nr:hypothetical protein [Clostridia bacterium]
MYFPNSLFGLILPIVIFLLAVLIISTARKISEFINELKYIDIELSRASADRRRHWRRQKAKLYLSLLPFFKYENR